jgi:hypothetical protein
MFLYSRLCCLDKSFRQVPALSLDSALNMSFPPQLVLPLNMSVLTQPLLPVDMPGLQQLVLHLVISVQQQLVLYQVVCDQQQLVLLFNCLFQEPCASPGCVCLQEL